MATKTTVWCAAEHERMVNGTVTPTGDEAATITDHMKDNSPKPSAERCRLSEIGDQLNDDVTSPLSATSPISENGGDLGASVSGNEDCGGIGMFDIDEICCVHVLNYAG